jgi:pimeloyl-ACP methyl ester carboxylesterase
LLLVTPVGSVRSTACRVVLVSLLFVVAACGATLTPAAMASPGVSSRSAVTMRVLWTGCPGTADGARLQCAQVRVPLDWSRPHGATISLKVIRRLASRRGQRIGSMFFNPGGPGVSGVGTVSDPQEGAQLDRAAGGRFDIVSWDPRGTNASTPVRCFRSDTLQAKFWGSEPFPITRAQSLAYLAKTVAYARRCRQLSGRLLAHISTADTARDLDRLRQLVGDRQLTYYGWSYGTFLGQTYANLFPGRVRAMVLDGVLDPVATVASMEARLANGVSSTDLVFAKFLSLCQRAGPVRCTLAGHGASPAARVNGLLRRLQRGPIPAPAAKPAGELTYADALFGVYGALNSPGGWPALAADLDAAAGGDGSALATRARACDSECLRAALVPSQAVHCADTPARQGPQAWPSVIGRLARISRLRGALLGWWLWSPCTAWTPPNKTRYTGPWNAPTKHPILVIGTRWDPATSYANARRVATLLDNAVLLTHDGYGHTSPVDPSTCVASATSAYLVRLITPRRGTVCPSDRQPFDPNFGHPSPGEPVP